jgi:hypothetical protein
MTEVEIVRGARRGEQQIFCGFIFPPQEHFFTVRECTDFRPRRRPIQSFAA